MKTKFAILIACSLILIYVMHFVNEGEKVLRPTNASSTFFVSPQEMAELMAKGKAGDCHASFRIAQHFSYVTMQFDQAIAWLRLAVSCPEAPPKELLVALLLEVKDQSSVAEEIDRLIIEIQKVNPEAAMRANREVQNRRSHVRRPDSAGQVPTRH